MDVISHEQQRLLKNSIPALRKAGGWSQEQFGAMIGVTKQAISSLETETNKIPSKTFYIAAKYVLQDEIKKKPNMQLSRIYKLAFASNNTLTKENTEKIEQAVALTSGGLLGGLAFASITAGLIGLLGTALYAVLGLDSE